MVVLKDFNRMIIHKMMLNSVNANTKKDTGLDTKDDMEDETPTNFENGVQEDFQLSNQIYSATPVGDSLLKKQHQWVLITMIKNQIHHVCMIVMHVEYYVQEQV